MDHRLPKRLCLLALLALFVVAPLGHVQGLRAVLAVLVAACALGRPLTALRPIAAAWLAWLLLGAISYAWSALPAATLKSVAYEMLLPFIVFLGAARAVDSTRAIDAVGKALLVGLAVLAMLSGYAHATGQQALLITPAEAAGVLRFFPGVGVASTFAAIAYPICLIQWQVGGYRRMLSALAIVCILVVGIAAPNRMLWITLFGATAVYLLAGVQTATAQRRWLMPLTLLAAAAVSAALFALTLQQRGQSIAEDWTRLGNAVSSESRFIGWQLWVEQAAKNPVVGVGFGKAAARAAYRSALPEELARKDNAMLDHAHNLLLNIQLQLGALGVIVFLVLVAALARYYLRALGEARSGLAARAGLALVAAMLLKNATDDFMGHAVVIIFWAIAGALAGYIGDEARRKSEASV